MNDTHHYLSRINELLEELRDTQLSLLRSEKSLSIAEEVIMNEGSNLFSHYEEQLEERG